MAIPLIMIGLVQCVVGYSDYARRDYQMNNVAYNLGMNKKGVIEKEEGPRMKKVIVNFVIYRWVEIALAAAGAVMFLIFRGSPDKVFYME